jgi:hypothetical protein
VKFIGEAVELGHAALFGSAPAWASATTNAGTPAMLA